MIEMAHDHGALTGTTTSRHRQSDAVAVITAHHLAHRQGVWWEHAMADAHQDELH
jgi:hypothetical protein